MPGRPRRPNWLSSVLVHQAVRPGGREAVLELVGLRDQQRRRPSHLRRDHPPISGFQRLDRSRRMVDQGRLNPPSSAGRAVAVRAEPRAPPVATPSGTMRSTGTTSS
jgi:hypothetical protein